MPRKSICDNSIDQSQRSFVWSRTNSELKAKKKKKERKKEKKKKEKKRKKTT